MEHPVARTTPARAEGERVPEGVREAIAAAQHHLLALQHEDGHWCGELEGDTILESEYILVMYYMGRVDDPRVRKAANYVRSKQQPHGGWATYPGGPPDVSVSAKAYFVLKLLGDAPDAPHMLRARDCIRGLGGLDACNSFTKIYLSIFGQYDWDRCPTVPPEIILLPPWFYFNIYEMSSWSRAIVVPLSIISAKRPYCPVPDAAGIGELRVPGRSSRPGSLWGAMFQGLDAALKILERFPIQVPREFAIQKCEQWTLDRLEDSDGLGAIFPPIVNTIYGLHALGYSFDHPAVQGQVHELERLEIEEGDTLRVQPCFGPVWDTALSVNALLESGMAPDHEALLRAARWMMDKRGHEDGDWRVKNRRTRKAGWFFEYANPYYPDCDTTSKVIIALSKIRWPDRRERRECVTALAEAQRWHQTMQNRDGGWGAFDRACDKEILTHVPFADHNAMIDPSTEDLTARALEMMACVGLRREQPAVRRAIEYLKKKQEPDGSWFGRWGVNYLYGTWLALWGLEKMGEDLRDAPWARRAAAWIRSCQNADGGWGESPASYADSGKKGKGESTASQTAWAVLGLLAAGEVGSDAVRRGVGYLLAQQSGDGGWSEEPWTGTGFPEVFYLKYHMYPIYFPLLALGEYAKRLTDGGGRDVAPARDDADDAWNEAGAIAS